MVSSPLILSDAQDEPEEQDSGQDKKCIHQSIVAYSPACQGEPDADQSVHEEKDQQVEVQLGVHMYGLLQGQECSVVPGIARYQEDDHEDEEHPGR